MNQRAGPGEFITPVFSPLSFLDNLNPFNFQEKNSKRLSAYSVVRI